jgi:hypothetical protein
MKVRELIAALQLRDPELEVYAYNDHGQTPEKVGYPGVVWLDPDGDDFAGSSQEAKEYGYTVKAVLL